MGDVENLARVLAQHDGDSPKAWNTYAGKAEAILADIKRLRDNFEEVSILAETDDYIDLRMSLPPGHDSDGMWIAENDGNLSGAIVRADDYRVSGVVWRVHQGDADPFPSRPHAHCVGGAKKFLGCKLHLGTARLYRGKEPFDRLPQKRFERLIDLIRPKFPGVILPLPMS